MVLPSIGQNKCCGNSMSSVFTFKMADHYGNHRYLEENSVHISLVCPIDGSTMLKVYLGI